MKYTMNFTEILINNTWKINVGNNTWNMHENLIKDAWNMHETYMEHTWNSSETSIDNASSCLMEKCTQVSKAWEKVSLFCIQKVRIQWDLNEPELWRRQTAYWSTDLLLTNKHLEFPSLRSGSFKSQCKRNIFTQEKDA